MKTTIKCNVLRGLIHSTNGFQLITFYVVVANCFIFSGSFALFDKSDNEKCKKTTFCNSVKNTHFSICIFMGNGIEAEPTKKLLRVFR